jgi:HK97 family phage prohead protease
MKAKEHLLTGIKDVSEEGVFEGLLATYNNVDLGGDLIEPGAFTKTIQEHGSSVKLLWQHNVDEPPIGTLMLMDTPEALRVRGRLELEMPKAHEIYTALRKRLVNGLSIGFDTVKDSIENGIRHLKEIRLWEGSIVNFPMNERAMILAVKSVKAGRMISAANKEKLQMAHEHIKSTLDSGSRAAGLIFALLDDEADDDEEVTSAKEAANPKSEPDPLHSAAKILDDLRSLIPTAQ